jgi:mono/diheme cytochrome c family protein
MSSRYSPLRFMFFLSCCIAVGLSLCMRQLLAYEDSWRAPDRAAAKQNPVAADDKSIAAGRDVYLHQCRSCHGDSGHGDGPDAVDITPTPRDLADSRIVEQSDGALFWKITRGKRPMPSFEKLTSENERWEVINYVRTLAPPSTRPAR